MAEKRVTSISDLPTLVKALTRIDDLEKRVQRIERQMR